MRGLRAERSSSAQFVCCERLIGALFALAVAVTAKTIPDGVSYKGAACGYREDASIAAAQAETSGTSSLAKASGSF
jgi:hypothetical protein